MAPAEAYHDNLYVQVKYPNAIQAALDSTKELALALDDISKLPTAPSGLRKIPTRSVCIGLLATGMKRANTPTGFAQHPRRRKGGRAQGGCRRWDAKGHSEGKRGGNGNPPGPTI